MERTENIETKNLDHLGIVAGVCSEIGLVSVIDKYPSLQPQASAVLTWGWRDGYREPTFANKVLLSKFFTFD